jgi:tripartite-type tricarboxylate transporter receptor subunit TctC
MKKIARFALIMCLLHAFFAAAIAQAESAEVRNFPKKPIRILVTHNPGAGADFVARLIAKKLQETVGWTVIAENRPGAGGNVAAEVLANSTPDGYTLLVAAPGPILINQSLMKLPYDPLKQIMGITYIGDGPCILAVRPDLPAKSVKEVIELARTTPKQLSYGSSGMGSSPHMAAELFMHMTKTKMVHVPYKGSGAAVLDVMAGRLDLIITTAPALLSKIQAGSVRGIAVTSLTRYSKLPDLPTLDEAGLKGFEYAVWRGLYAPAGTPLGIVDKLHGAVAGALKMEDVRAAMDKRGEEPRPSATPKAFNEFMRKEAAKWADVIKAAGIKLK